MVRLLLAEDDPLIGQGLQLGLRQEGFRVDWVKDGQAANVALEMKTVPYSLLLLDLSLPHLDGMTLLNDLRKKESPLPVIIITARDALADRLSGLDNGADDYLVKPFALQELVSRIRAVLRRHRGRAHTAIMVGRLRLDPAHHQLWLGDEEVIVSPKEFTLLNELMTDPAAVLSREQLEERLYGWGEEIGSNAVEVYIFNLRKKLGSNIIETVRGVGYRLGDV